MRLIFLFLIGVVLFQSCRSSKDATQSGATDERLIGDWTMAPVSSRESPVVFSFGDTLGSYLYPFGAYTRYWVKGDTLSMVDKEGSTVANEKPEVHTFLLNLVNEDQLDLIPISESSQAMLRQAGMEPSDTFHLQRIQQKSTDVPMNITFYSSVCYGTCPSMYLSINSKGEVRFYGLNFTDPEGGHMGQLTQQQYYWIIRQVQQIPNDLDRWYRASWTDDQTACITLDYPHHTIQSCAYGYDKEPVELRILLHHLMQLYKQIDLQPADIKPEDFEHHDMMNER